MQLTVVRIAGYGPWTLTLGSDREHELQILQSSLYGRLQRALSSRGCLLFQGRHDEMFAVTNGLGEAGHLEALEAARGGTGLDVRMCAGRAEAPLEACARANEAGLAEAAGAGRPVAVPDGPPADRATVMHLDVDGMTAFRRGRVPYAVASAVFGLYAEMSRFFERRGSMSFFMGGDNFMVAASEEGRAAAPEFLEVAAGLGLPMNCGVGTAPTGREAAGLATGSLDGIREDRAAGRARPRVREASCC